MPSPLDDAAIACASAGDSQWPPQVRLRLADGVGLTATGPYRWALTHRGQTFAFVLPRATLSAVFTKLATGVLSMADVAAQIEADTSAGVDRHPLSTMAQLTRLWRAGLVRLTLVGDTGDNCTIVATMQGGSVDVLIASGVRDSEPIALRDGVCLCKDGDAIVIESPESGARIALRDRRLHRAVVIWLEAPTPPAALARRADVPVAWAAALATWLVSSGAARVADGADVDIDGRGYWSLADRLFHARSRMGRHTGDYGGTFRFRDIVAAPPLTRPSRGGSRLGLSAPDLDALIATDRPFSDVFERRRSIREHGDAPIALEQLAHFLYRTARVKGRVRSDHYDYTTRPYPSGGAMYELEIYVLVNRCEGLAPALYWYDPEAHALESVSEPTPDTQALSDDAMRSTGESSPPQVLLIVSARFPRVFWKYESMGYALILKNVGVLFDAMYLVATAMGLAPCALGGGNAETFCRAARTQFWEESSVGEFMLGRPR
jgi:SagB-type dehydrogenase family enzyme